MALVMTRLTDLLSGLFVGVLNRSLVAGVMVVLVLILRFVLKKVPKWAHCLLWALVALELLFPLHLTSPLSIYNAPTLQSKVVQQTGTTSRVEFFTYSETPEKPTASIDLPAFSGYPDNRPDLPEAVHTTRVYLPDFVAVWVTGIAAFALYGAVSYMRLRKQTSASIQRSDGLWLCDDIDTPFILGILRPRIYVPSYLEGEVLDHVAAHEKAHLHRHDHWWKPLGFALLAVNWFNPLLWLGYVTLCKDIELACDEKVCQTMDASLRKSYAEALLLCSMTRGAAIAACPLAFGEVGVKERVSWVVKYRKPAFFAVIAGVLVCVVTALMFLTGPSEYGFFRPFGNELERHGWDFDLMISGSPAYASLPESVGVPRVSVDYHDSYPDAMVSNLHLYAKDGRFVIWDWEELPIVYASGTYKKEWGSFGGTETYDLRYDDGSVGRATLGEYVNHADEISAMMNQLGLPFHPDEDAPDKEWSLYFTKSDSFGYSTYHFMNSEEMLREVPEVSYLELNFAAAPEAVRYAHSRAMTPPEYCYGVGFHYLSHENVKTKKTFADGTRQITVYGMTYISKYWSPELSQNGELREQVPYLYYGPAAVTLRINEKDQWVVVEYHEKEDALSYLRNFPAEIRKMVDDFNGQAQLQKAAREDALEQFALKKTGSFLPQVGEFFEVGSDAVPQTTITFLQQDVNDPYCRSTLLYPMFTSDDQEWESRLFTEITEPLSEYYLGCPMDSDNLVSSAIIQDKMYTRNMAWGTIGDYFWFRFDFQWRPFGCPDEEDWTRTHVWVIDPSRPDDVVTVGDLFPNTRPSRLTEKLRSAMENAAERTGANLTAVPDDNFTEYWCNFVPSEEGLTLFFGYWNAPDTQSAVSFTWKEIGEQNVFGFDYLS